MTEVPIPDHGRRTNSLGRAADDCFACQRARRLSSLDVACDRQRPRCNNCNSAKRICSGYKLSLQWMSPALTSDTASSQTVQFEVLRQQSADHRKGERRFIREDPEQDYLDKSFHDTPSMTQTQPAEIQPRIKKEDDRTEIDHSDDDEPSTSTDMRNPYTGDFDGAFSLAWSHGIPIPFTKPKKHS